MKTQPVAHSIWMSEELHELEDKNLFRKCRTFKPVSSTQAVLDGNKVTLFSTNDYLGLAQHPALVAAAQNVLESHGVGAKSARLISGTSDLHQALEERIARFEGKERALVFSTGYLANLGTISALADKEDEIILDKLDHASLIDAARLSGAKIRVYPHLNLKYLGKLLQNSKARRTWIVTDSLFSMDGDLAPLRELVELKKRYGAYLIIDEAHGTGVFGDRGRGVSEHLGVSNEIDVHIGTLSKAVGTLGGFVTGKVKLIDYLVNKSRTFIFSTALPPSICAAAIAALDLIENKPGLRKRLWKNVNFIHNEFRQLGAPVLEGRSPILPVVVGDERKTLEISRSLLEQGFYVPAVRYPTVAKGKARLRLTISAAHTEDQINSLLNVFVRVLFKR